MTSPGTASDATGSELIAKNLTELICMILLPVGAFMVCYALYIFIWRANAIAQKKVR